MTTPRRNAWPRAGAGGRSSVDLAWSRALAHPVRVEILQALLQQEPGTPSGFATTLEIPLGVASHHVRRLRDLRLIRITRRTHRRGAVQHHYRLVDRDATAHALWRWGLAIEEEAFGDATDAPSAHASAAGRETMEQAVAVLRREREAQGVTRPELADRAGISTDHLDRIERGEADPRVSVLLALASALDRSLRDVFGEAEAATS